MSFSKLTQPLIVDEALAILREGGMAQLSLRQVAARLGVRISSLYWHVKDRNALYTLLCERIFRGCLDAVPESQGWEQWLHDFGMSLWIAQLDLPDVRHLLAATAFEAGMKDRVQDEILTILERLGLARDIGDPAQQSVQALVSGWNSLREKSAADTKAFEHSLEALIDGWQMRHAVSLRPASARL